MIISYWYESIDYQIAVFAHAWEEINGVFCQVREVLSVQVNRFVIDFFRRGKRRIRSCIIVIPQVVSFLILSAHAWKDIMGCFYQTQDGIIVSGQQFVIICNRFFLGRESIIRSSIIVVLS